MIEKDKIVYPRDGIDKLFEMYPKSFKKQSKSFLKTAEKIENKTNYKNLSKKILFFDGRFHQISFLKRYDTLYSLLEDLVTRKTTVNSANADQISFMINLFHSIVL